MFLILDVRKAGEPFWIKSNLLYTIVSRVDGGTKRSRGYIVVENVPSQYLN